MAEKMDLSLDDIIKINKKTNVKGKRGRGGRRSTGGGVAQARNNKRGGGRGRGNRGRSRSASAPYTRSGNVPNDKWDHDMYNSKQGNQRRSFGGTENKGGSGKLVVSNLDYGVSDSDITELFSEFGALRKSAVHYDRSGRSLGTADVHFERRTDAMKALKQYNGIPLDGRAMQIKFADAAGANNPPTEFNGRIGQKRGGGGGGGGGTRGQSNRGGRGGRGGTRGRGRGGGRQQKKVVSAEELDKQLDDYISKMEE